ncbi:MAG: hypothetical protein ACKVYV_13255 [Limisphaerales bacterium]
MNEWNFQGRARACHACEKAFADGQAYHTLLFEGRHGYDRHDVCASCWEAQHRHGATERRGFISHWQGVFEAPPAAPSEPIPREDAESLLRRLVERADPGHHAARFILAAMLERKRQLKVRDQFRQDGRRVFVYELARTGEVFTILDPELRLAELDSVQRTVADLLEHGLPGGEAAEAGAATALPPEGPPPDEAGKAAAETGNETTAVLAEPAPA